MRKALRFMTMKILNLRLFSAFILICNSLLMLVSPAHAQGSAPPRVSVSSPIHLTFEIPCKDVASVQVVLDDEVKDIIARQIFIPDCDGQTEQSIKTKIYFDTFERLTPAHLTISAYDSETRWMWMITENIVFTDLNTPMHYAFKSKNPLAITLPTANTFITDRYFQVKGSVQVGLSRSAYFELVSDQGLVLGNALVTIPSSVVDGQWDFDFQFQITSPRYVGGARLTMQQYGVDIYGIESLTTTYLQLDI